MGDEASKMTHEFNEGRASKAVALPSTAFGGGAGFRNDLSQLTPSIAREGSRTLIIFDWDDTLLCSSALRLAQPSAEMLRQLERAVESILLAAMTLGETLIVTNGTESWVQDSATKFVPGLLPILQGLTTISARARYEHRFPEDPFAWKREAFQDLLSSFAVANYSPASSEASLRTPASSTASTTASGLAATPTTGVNLVAIGDSWYEIEAARSTFGLPSAPSAVKTVKFKEVPTIQELLGQLRRSVQELARVVKGEGSASWGLSAKPLPPHLACLTACASAWEMAPEQARFGLCWDVQSQALVAPQPLTLANAGAKALAAAPSLQPPCYLEPLAVKGPRPSPTYGDAAVPTSGLPPPPPLPHDGVARGHTVTCGWVF